MTVCIIGGGNIGTLLAAEFACRGISVRIYSEHSDRWSDCIEVLDPSGKLLMKADNVCVTRDLAFAIDGAEQIWITVPAFMFAKLGERLQPIIQPEQTVIVVPGTGGAEFAFDGILKKGCTLAGLQRVHSIARLKEYGRSVFMLGRKTELYLASIPCSKASFLAKRIETMLEIPCSALPNYLSVTLTPSNPILHTSRLYAMFSDWEPGRYYDHNFLFYEEWTDESSGILVRCDNELQKICNLLEPLDLRNVRSLKIHYESETPRQLTEKIRSITAFKGLSSPMRQCPNGWVPDFTSRYFTADFSFGLKIIYDIAKCIDAKTETIDRLWEWYCNASNAKTESYFTLPCNNKQQLIRKYS